MTALAAVPKHEAQQDDSLAGEINEAHRAVIRTNRQSVEHAIRCGELLTEQKARHKHGEWQRWVGDNCEFSIRTDQLYRKLAKDAENAQQLAHLGVAGTAAVLYGKHGNALIDGQDDQLVWLQINKAAREMGAEQGLVLTVDGIAVGEAARKPRRSMAVRGYVAALEDVSGLLADADRGVLSLAEVWERLELMRERVERNGDVTL